MGLPKILLNPKAHKTGRSKVDVKARNRDKKTDRVHNKAAQKVRRDLNVVSLDDVANSIEDKWPDVYEADRNLASVGVLFAGYDEATPKYSLMKNPVLNKDASYVLPQTLLKACIAAFLASTNAMPVFIDHDAETIPASAKPVGVRVVSIKGIGVFSHGKIMSMKRVAILKTTMKEVVDTCEWLKNQALPAVPVYQQESVQERIVLITKTYSFTLISGFNDTLPYRQDLTHSILARALPPTRLNDAILLGFSTRLCAAYPSCRTTDIVSASSRTLRGRAQLVSDAVLEQLRAHTSFASNMSTVLVPVNMGNAHWCSIVVSINNEQIRYYDPLSQSDYLRALDDLAEHISFKVFRVFTKVSVTFPIQRDAFSCGVFAVWFFYRQLEPTAVKSMLPLNRRRFEMFYDVFKGRSTPRPHGPANTSSYRSSSDRTDCSVR